MAVSSDSVNLLFSLVVSWTSHIGHQRSDWLYLPHELVAASGVVVVHIIGEVSDVQDQVEVTALSLVLQIRQRLRK